MDGDTPGNAGTREDAVDDVTLRCKTSYPPDTPASFEEHPLQQQDEDHTCSNTHQGAHQDHDPCRVTWGTKGRPAR